jgi:muramidase (phage lysozyme)
MSNEYILSKEDINLLDSRTSSEEFAPDSLQSSNDYSELKQPEQVEDVKPDTMPQKNLINTSGAAEIPKGEALSITNNKNAFDSATNYAHIDSSKALRQSIGKYESSSDSNAVAGMGSSHGKDFNKMTINEVTEWQKTLPPNKKAAGKYQFIPETLLRMAKSAGLSGDEFYNEETQDKLAHKQLEELGLDDYQNGKITLEQFAKRVAGTWAAFPVLSDTTIEDKFGKRELKSGDSYYKGVGGNKANVTPEEFIKILQNIGAGEPLTQEVLNEDGTSKLTDQQKSQLTEIFAMNTAPTLQGGHNSYVTTDDKYDKEMNISLDRIGAYRAAKQSTWNKLGSAITRVGLNTGLSAVGYLAAIADVEDYNNQDDEVGNLVTNTMEEWKAHINKEYAPIYKKSNEHLAVNDAGWWLENGSSLVESIGAFALAGIATGGTATWLAGVAGLGAMGSALATLATATALNQAEGVTSGAQVYKDIYKYHIDAGKSDKQAKSIASRAAARTIDVNRINILLNLTSANMFVKAGGGIAGTGRNIMKGISTLATRNKVVGESGQEFLEEEINLIADKAGRAFGKGQKYGMSEIMEDLNTAEAAEAGLLGAIGGAGQTIVSAGIGNIDSERYTGKYVQQQKDFNEQQEYIKQLEESFAAHDIPGAINIFASKDSQKKTAEEVRNIVLTAQDENRDLTEEEKAKVSKATESDLTNHAILGLQSGTIGKVVELYENIANLSEEEAAAKGLMQKDVKPTDPGYYKNKANEALEILTKAELQYNKSAKFKSNRIPVTLNRVNRDLESERLDKRINDVSEIEAEIALDKANGKPENVAKVSDITLSKAEVRAGKEKLKIFDEQYRKLTDPAEIKKTAQNNKGRQYESAIEAMANTESAEELYKAIEKEDFAPDHKEALNNKLTKQVDKIKVAEAEATKEEDKKANDVVVAERVEANNERIVGSKEDAQAQLDKLNGVTEDGENIPPTTETPALTSEVVEKADNFNIAKGVVLYDNPDFSDKGMTIKSFSAEGSGSKQYLKGILFIDNDTGKELWWNSNSKWNWEDMFVKKLPKPTEESAELEKLNKNNEEIEKESEWELVETIGSELSYGETGEPTPEADVDVDFMAEQRQDEGENTSNNEFLNQVSEDNKTVPGARGIEALNEINKNSEAYSEWLFSPSSKVGTKVRIVPLFKYGMDKAVYQSGGVPLGNINYEVQFLNEDGTPITINGEPVTTELWTTRRNSKNDKGPRENNPAAQLMLETQREVIADKLRRGETVETRVSHQLPAAFKETKGQNNNIPEAFDMSVEDLNFGVVRHDGNYSKTSNTKTTDSDLSAFPAAPKLAGRIYIKIPNNVGQLIPALLNIRHLNDAESDLIIDLYSEMLKNPEEFRLTEVSKALWKRFQEVVPGEAQEMLGNIPNYDSLINFLVYADNNSINPDKNFVYTDGVLSFGTQKATGEDIDTQKAALKEFLMITQRRKVDINKLSDKKSEYRKHIVNNDILTTDIDKGPVNFTRAADTKNARFKGSVYLAPIADPNVEALTQASGEDIKIGDTVIKADKPAPQTSEVKTPTVIATGPKTFLPSPNEDGTFDGNYETQSFKKSESVYELRSLGNGEYEFDISKDETTVQRALSYADVFIDPVANWDMNSEESGKFITTIKKGKLQKTDKGFKVIEKPIFKVTKTQEDYVAPKKQTKQTSGVESKRKFQNKVYIKAYDELRNKPESKLKSTLETSNESAKSGGQSSPISVARSFIARKILDGKTKELDAQYAKQIPQTTKKKEVDVSMVTKAPIKKVRGNQKFAKFVKNNNKPKTDC